MLPVLIFKTDVDDSLYESDEQDNTAMAPIVFELLPPPNLTRSSWMRRRSSLGRLIPSSVSPGALPIPASARLLASGRTRCIFRLLPA